MYINDEIRELIDYCLANDWLVQIERLDLNNIHISIYQSIESGDVIFIEFEISFISGIQVIKYKNRWNSEWLYTDKWATLIDFIKNTIR